MRLLYISAQWHSLAKLRMHHDMSLQLLDYTTTWLGAQMRLFNHDTCSKVSTKELQREADARARREGKGKASKGTAARQPAKLGIFTIKFHFLGDYVDYIRHFGTRDSYSSETVGSVLRSSYARYPPPCSLLTYFNFHRASYSIAFQRRGSIALTKGSIMVSLLKSSVDMLDWIESAMTRPTCRTTGNPNAEFESLRPRNAPARTNRRGRPPPTREWIAPPRSRSEPPLTNEWNLKGPLTTKLTTKNESLLTRMNEQTILPQSK
jgi:hypothetical protein